jgi:hypothetical protein
MIINCNLLIEFVIKFLGKKKLGKLIPSYVGTDDSVSWGHDENLRPKIHRRPKMTATREGP